MQVIRDGVKWIGTCKRCGCVVICCYSDQELRRRSDYGRGGYFVECPHCGREIDMPVPDGFDTED